MRFDLKNLAFAAVLVLGTGSSAYSGLINPGFETPATGVAPGTAVTFTGSAGMLDCVQFGPPTPTNPCSAALGYNVHTNAPGDSVTTTLVPSPFPGGGSYALQVATTGPFAGIWQPLSPPNTGPNFGIASASVIVNPGSGNVFLGSGNDGLTSPNAYSSTTPSVVQFLSSPNGNSPVNEIVVYSNTTKANFLVDNVAFTPNAVPEPGTISMLLGGFGGLALYFRRRVRS